MDEESNWCKKASRLKSIITDNAYSSLNTGILSIEQINELLASYSGNLFFMTICIFYQKIKI